MLTDNEIVLRAPEPGDVDAMYIIENDTLLWNDGVIFAPVSRKQLWDYVDNYNGDIYATGQLRFVIEMLADGGSGGVVGTVDLYDYDRLNRRAYVGITVVSGWRGKGVGGRALELLRDYCCHFLGMHNLAAVVRADNDASRSLFERHGFEVTGRFHGWVRRGEEWVDALHYQCVL